MTEEYNNVTEQLNQIGQTILAAARDELYLGMRFLDVALSSFIYQMITEVSPFGTDGVMLYFHPRELGGLYKQNRILVNRGYLHMVYHCLFRHMLKIIPLPEYITQNDMGKTDSDDKIVRQTDEEEKESDRLESGDNNRWKMSVRYWNLACDIAVEHLVDSNYHRSVRFSRSLLRRETYRKLEDTDNKGENGATNSFTGSQNSDGFRKEHRKRVLNAERIYRELLAWDLSGKELIQLEAEFYVDDHRYWENRDPEQKPPNPDLNQKWQDINEQMETDLETFSKEASEKNGELLGQLAIENRQKQDYREFLRKFSVIREEIGVDPDTFDYTFYSYGLSLYGNMPLIEPQETREVKKVQDFDVVTLDRLKKIDVEASFEVWKEYAYQQGLHPAVISYLELRKQNFYRVETTVDGKLFATARGWEDLSQLIQVYEVLEKQVDRAVVYQYIQHWKIAKDFANYLELYYKYRTDYGVEDILEGKWSPITLQKIRSAALDEHLSIVSLLNGRLSELFGKCYETDAFVTKLYEYMLYYKKQNENDMAQTEDEMLEDIGTGREGGASVKAVYQKAENDMTSLKKAELLTRKEERTWKRILEFLEKASLDVKGQLLAGEKEYSYVKQLFEKETERLENVTARAEQTLQNVFDFLEEAFGESQEMIFFITELNANTYSMWFIRENGSDSYYRYNKGILFEQRQQAILGEMDALENAMERGLH